MKTSGKAEPMIRLLVDSPLNWINVCAKTPGVRQSIQFLAVPLCVSTSQESLCEWHPTLCRVNRLRECECAPRVWDRKEWEAGDICQAAYTASTLYSKWDEATEKAPSARASNTQTNGSRLLLIKSMACVFEHVLLYVVDLFSTAFFRSH